MPNKKVNIDEHQLKERPNWDIYFMNQALTIATRGTCNRLKVGTIITKNNQIISSGYNGSLPNDPHCTDEGCLIKDGHCIRTIHSEMNAVLQCARKGIPMRDAVAYVTHRPCLNCLQALIQAGVKEIKYLYQYKEVDAFQQDLLDRNRVKCTHIGTTNFFKKLQQLQCDILNVVSEQTGDFECT